MTTAASSGVRFLSPSQFVFQLLVEPLPAHVSFARQLPSDYRLSKLLGPTLIDARWMTDIKRRIDASVPQEGVSQVLNDGSWLNQEIANTALAFFSATSDVLPAAEPYIYTTMNGDLVAEFSSMHGKLTSIVSKGAVLAYAVVNGQPVTSKLRLPFDNVEKARRCLEQITEQLRTGEHGTVEA